VLYLPLNRKSGRGMKVRSRRRFSNYRAFCFPGWRKNREEKAAKMSWTAGPEKAFLKGTKQIIPLCGTRLERAAGKWTGVSPAVDVISPIGEIITGKSLQIFGKRGADAIVAGQIICSKNIKDPTLH